MGDGVRAFTPWGELAYALGGKTGYEALRKSDEQRRAPGAENVRALFKGEPAIILLDELSIYLRKVRGREDAAQLTPFLTVLFEAVESAPGAALVFTLAIGKGNRATDAYGEENEFVAHRLAGGGECRGEEGDAARSHVRTESDATVWSGPRPGRRAAGSAGAP